MDLDGSSIVNAWILKQKRSMRVKCGYCGKRIEKESGAVNRARKIKAHLYCDKRCFGLSRRQYKSRDQKVEEKRLYDLAYRRKNRATLKVKKHDYFVRTYDPVAAAEVRKVRMPQHIEYCRQPSYRRWKRRYDRQYRANRLYGPFAECFLLLQKIDKEVDSRLSDYEVRQINGTLNKRQERKRVYERLIRG